jgi:hypothetical protein
MARNTRATFGTVWTFKAGRFLVSLELKRDYSYQYDGDDEDGETQRALDCGEYVAFDSVVTVELDGEEIGRNSLCGSVYVSDGVASFYTDHRCDDPMNRNCSAMRAARGDNVVICHYFPDMVSQAIAEARETIAARKAELTSLPYVRAA